MRDQNVEAEIMPGVAVGPVASYKQCPLYVWESGNDFYLMVFF